MLRYTCWQSDLAVGVDVHVLDEHMGAGAGVHLLGAPLTLQVAENSLTALIHFGALRTWAAKVMF